MSHLIKINAVCKFSCFRHLYLRNICIIIIVSGVATLLSSSLPEIRAADCSNTAVTKRLSGCVQLDLGSLMVVQKFESLISNLCGLVKFRELIRALDKRGI